MISPFEATLRSLTDASRQYDAELARFAANTQRAAKRDADHIIHTAERLIRDAHDQLSSASVAIRRRRRRARRRAAAVKQKRRSPLKPLSTNDVAATREQGSRARGVKQLLQNDRLRPPVEPAVPLVAPLAPSRSSLSPAPTPSSPAHEVRAHVPSPASSLHESPQPPDAPPAHARASHRNDSSPPCHPDAHAAHEADTFDGEPHSKPASPSVDDHDKHASPSADHHASLASPHDAQREQSARSTQDKPIARDRRSSATVESYETANAELSAARVSHDTETATSRAVDCDVSPALSDAQRSRVRRTSGSCSTDPQPNRQQPHHHEQSPVAKADARSPREQPPSPKQDVRMQSDEHASAPEQKQLVRETPQPASSEPLPHERLSLHSGHNQSRLRSSSQTTSSDAPANVSCDEPEAQSAEHENITQEEADQESLTPHSDSRTERQTSFSPPQSDAQDATPEAGREDDRSGDMCSNAAEGNGESDCSREAERSSDDGVPESIQGSPEAPGTAANLHIQQPTATAEAVETDMLESRLPDGSELNQRKHESPPSQSVVFEESASRSSQQTESHPVGKPSIQSGGGASDATLAKEIDSCNNKPICNTKLEVEREATVHETAQVSSGRSGSSPEKLSRKGNDAHLPSSMLAPPQLPASRIPRKPSRIVVDNTGKIDHSSLHVLSRVMSTKHADKARGDTEIARSAQKLTTPRTTRLFKPNNNIYSLQQNGNASPVQQFSSLNRSSILSHTPGAEAPFRRQSPGVSRQQRLESLNKQLESFQNSKGAELQGPELQMAELRHGRTGAHVLGDLGNLEVSQLAREDDNVLRSVRERTLKLAETHVKDTSKIDIWSLHAKGAKTTPAREKLRARERSKSKSAFRSQLQQIMTGRACSPDDDGEEENKFNSTGSRLLDISNNEDSTVEPKVRDNTEEKLSRMRSHGEDRSSLLMGSKDIVISPADAQPRVGLEEHELRSETKSASVEADESDKGNAFVSEHPVVSFSNAHGEEHEAAESDVCIPEFQSAPATNAPLTNLMTSIVSFLPGTSSLLGTRPTREEPEETEAEAAAKRQKLDMERREAEVQARREAQRLLKQKETEEKQRRAEKRRLLLARADKEKEEEKRKKEARRMKKKLEEEEARKKKKQEDDRKKEERRRLVLEKRAQNEMKLKRKKKVEPPASRKVAKGISRKSWTPGQGASCTPDSDIAGNGKHKLSGTPSTPVAKSADASHGPSNYDMTPAQETVFELSDEEEERRKHKRIPQWAQGPKLSTAARDQPDPDDVFVNVPTCDLREVFGNVRRFRARTSSANWTRDRVTAQEMVKFRKGQAAFNEPRQ